MPYRSASNRLFVINHLHLQSHRPNRGGMEAAGPREPCKSGARRQAGKTMCGAFQRLIGAILPHRVKTVAKSSRPFTTDRLDGLAVRP
jgi:hypothetical protein